MSVFFSYIFLGISLAAPIGPVNAAQMDRGIKNGFLHSWFIGLGSITADIAYMLLVYFGFVNFIDSPFIKTFLYCFGCFVLLYTGVETLLGAQKVQLEYRNKDESLKKTFFTGFFMALSNPLTILFWLGIYGSVLANTASTYGIGELLIYSSGIILGLIIWDITMATISSSFRKILTVNALKTISYISGLTLIGFGGYFGYQAIRILTFS